MELAQKRSRFFYGYLILLATFLFQVVVHGCSGYSFGLYVLPLQDEFHWSRAMIMTGSLVWSLLMGFAAPFIGRFVNRWGARRVIAVGGLLIGVGFALQSLTRSLWQFYLLYAVIGLGSTASGVVSASMVLSHWFRKRRGFAIGILGMGIGVGGFTVPRLLSSYVIPSSWRMAYLVSGVTAVSIIFPLSLLVIRQTPEEMGLLPDNGRLVEAKTVQGKNGVSVVPETGLRLEQAMKTPAFWLMSVAFLAFSFANGHTFQNQTPHLQDVGFSAAKAAIALQAVGIGSATGKFGFGWLCDYIRPKYVLVIGSALEVVATLMLMGMTGSAAETSLWTYGLLMGLGVGSWLPVLSMATSATFGLLAYGVILGVYTMLFHVGNAIGPVVGGYVFDVTGSYNLPFKLCLIAYAVTVPTMLLVRAPRMD
ncbi:MAG: MFS transporter [Chloroflexota bacterium]